MSIIRFKSRQNSHTKPTKKRTAVLTITRIPKAEQKPEADFESGLFLGRFDVEGHEFCMDDGSLLGVIAHICNVTSIRVAAPAGPEVITLRAGSAHVKEIELLEDEDERIFVKRVQTGLRMTAQSRKNSRDTVDWWSSHIHQKALAHVPEHLQVNTVLERGVYDEFGEAMTAAQIATLANWERMMGMLQDPEHAEVGQIAIPWEHIVRMPDPHGPVAINGPAYVAVQTVLVKCGFPRMPRSYAELAVGVDFCDEVSRSQSVMRVGGESGGKEWLRAVVKVNRDRKRTLGPLLEACLRGDSSAVAELHTRTDWLVLLALEFKEDEPTQGY